jgi:hypothetical protein
VRRIVVEDLDNLLDRVEASLGVDDANLLRAILRVEFGLTSGEFSCPICGQAESEHDWVIECPGKSE